jgi:hypothetical protein
VCNDGTSWRWRKGMDEQVVEAFKGGSVEIDRLSYLCMREIE